MRGTSTAGWEEGHFWEAQGSPVRLGGKRSNVIGEGQEQKNEPNLDPEEISLIAFLWGLGFVL